MQGLVLVLLMYFLAGGGALAASTEDVMATARESCEGLESGTFCGLGHRIETGRMGQRPDAGVPESKVHLRSPLMGQLTSEVSRFGFSLSSDQ